MDSKPHPFVHAVSIPEVLYVASFLSHPGGGGSCVTSVHGAHLEAHHGKPLRHELQHIPHVEAPDDSVGFQRGVPRFMLGLCP